MERQVQFPGACFASTRHFFEGVMALNYLNEHLGQTVKYLGSSPPTSPCVLLVPSPLDLPFSISMPNKWLRVLPTNAEETRRDDDKLIREHAASLCWVNPEMTLVAFNTMRLHEARFRGLPCMGDFHEALRQLCGHFPEERQRPTRQERLQLRLESRRASHEYMLS